MALLNTGRLTPRQRRRMKQNILKQERQRHKEMGYNIQGYYIMIERK